MQERQSYQQLQPEERIAVASMRLEGLGPRAMGRRLGRSASTISRELTRNGRAGSYTSEQARSLHAARRRAARPVVKLDVDGSCWRLVRILLSWKWSPQQIAATLRATFPDSSEFHVSHETIYTAIYAHPRGELRRQPVESWPQPSVQPA